MDSLYFRQRLVLKTRPAFSTNKTQNWRKINRYLSARNFSSLAPAIWGCFKFWWSLGALFASFVIGQRNYIGFGFTILNWKALWAGKVNWLLRRDARAKRCFAVHGEQHLIEIDLLAPLLTPTKITSLYLCSHKKTLDENWLSSAFVPSKWNLKLFPFLFRALAHRQSDFLFGLLWRRVNARYVSF